MSKIPAPCPESEGKSLSRKPSANWCQKENTPPHFFPIPHHWSQNTVQNYVYLECWRNQNCQKKLKPNVLNSSQNYLQRTQNLYSRPCFFIAFVFFMRISVQKRKGRDLRFSWGNVTMKWTYIRKSISKNLGMISGVEVEPLLFLIRPNKTQFSKCLENIPTSAYL